VEKLDLNPVEQSWDQETRDAWKQYDVLLAYASGGGLAREIQVNRGDEMRSGVHGGGARTFLRLASIGSFGLYRHHEQMTPQLMAQLEVRRHNAGLKREVVVAGSVSAPAIIKPDRAAVVAGQ
jgi:hypothetical protein